MMADLKRTTGELALDLNHDRDDIHSRPEMRTLLATGFYKSEERHCFRACQSYYDLSADDINTLHEDTDPSSS